MRRRSVVLELLFFLSFTVLALTGCEKKEVTKADIDRVHPGMSGAEVEKILGRPATTSTTEIQGEPPVKQTMRIYWAGSTGVTVRFDANDRVLTVETGTSSSVTISNTESSGEVDEESDEAGTSSPEPAQASEQLRQVAEGGDAQGQYQVAMSYMQKTAGMSMGQAGESEFAREAAPWFRKAAEQGHAAAQFRIGNMYWRGWGGLSVDEKEAAQWFQKAAAQGHSDGEYQLGELYEYGRGGLKKDMKQAVTWYQKAAEKGQTDAEFALGKAYEQGKGGLPKDKALALTWYKKAADRGHRLAREKVE